jgi:hypothetical protein
MLFVTNYTGYQLLARPDITKLMPHPNGPDWGTINVVDAGTGHGFEFKPKGILTFAQREGGAGLLRPPALDGHRQAHTVRLVSRVTLISRGMTFEASDHWLFYSTFNTETDCPPVTDL